MEPGALTASAAAHCVLVACGALLWARAHDAPPPPRVVEVSIEEAPLPSPVRAGAPDGLPAAPSRSEPVPERVSVTARGRSVARPDFGEHGRGGTRAGQAATNLANELDPLTLERDTLNHLSESEVQRLRTAQRRRSLDDRRATPHPMELDFVVTGRGQTALRRPVAAADPNAGIASGRAPVPEGALRGAGSELAFEGQRGALVEGAQRVPAAGITSAPAGTDHHVSAAVTLARPSVPATRAAVPSSERDRASDDLDSRQRVASRVAALLQASTLGGDTTEGIGGEPAPGPPAAGQGHAHGSQSTPIGRGSGDGDFDDDLAQGFFRRVRAQINRALNGTFPLWAIEEGRGGLVVFDVALRDDGRIAAVSLVRPSGIDEYDRNVLRAVRSMSGFGPIPRALHAPLRISYDSRNPAVGRSGPGPGRVAD